MSVLLSTIQLNLLIVLTTAYAVQLVAVELKHVKEHVKTAPSAIRVVPLIKSLKRGPVIVKNVVSIRYLTIVIRCRIQQYFIQLKLLIVMNIRNAVPVVEVGHKHAQEPVTMATLETLVVHRMTITTLGYVTNNIAVCICR